MTIDCTELVMLHSWWFFVLFFRPWLPVTQVTEQGTSVMLITQTVTDAASLVSTISTKTGTSRYIYKTRVYDHYKVMYFIVQLAFYFIIVTFLHFVCFVWIFAETRRDAADLPWGQKCGGQHWTSVWPASHLLVWPQEPTWSKASLFHSVSEFWHLLGPTAQIHSVIYDYIYDFRLCGKNANFDCCT